MNKITKTDFRLVDHFDRCGYHYTKVEMDDKWMVWKMERDGQSYGYELWKYKKYINPDGNVIWCCPCDEDFGTYGWYIYFNNDDACLRRIEELKKNAS